MRQNSLVSYLLFTLFFLFKVDQFR